MKRGIDAVHEGENGLDESQSAKKPSTASQRFRDDLFDASVLEKYVQDYQNSTPYKHAVISNLLFDPLLRAVRAEIQSHLSFSPKETDIYKIHQSGDLANLDGLDDASLARLPSLLALRDALYSPRFRDYLSQITGAGPLSGQKTDMAINVYIPGCHLLCHDDVIGSRRVSYILYLTDPECPWRAEWGGALRLYQTSVVESMDGKMLRIPDPDPVLSIPPAFNQLSFFAVQPGESFHDVEEVYHAAREADTQKQEGQDGGRVRMAISGWYHIPQEGEDGFEAGLEAKLAEKSSLTQLQGAADELDLPQPAPVRYNLGSRAEQGGRQAEEEDIVQEEPLTETDLTYLLKFMSPTYLTPNTVEELEERFEDESSLILDRILSDKFSGRLWKYIQETEQEDLPKSVREIENSTTWKVARPPHKHRYLFQHACAKGNTNTSISKSPIQELLEDFLPSTSFQKWVRLTTGCPTPIDHDFIIRRFRRGKDYQLATSYDGVRPRLEVCLSLSPGFDPAIDAKKIIQDKGDEEINGQKFGDSDDSDSQEDSGEVGGYEMYMGGDDDEGEDLEEDEENNDDTNLRNGAVGGGNTGATRTSKKVKVDPAVYRESSLGDEDGVLFTMPASWNEMSIVLRDRGTMKFVKYVSQHANSDRWDISGAITLDPDGWEGASEDGNVEGP